MFNVLHLEINSTLAFFKLMTILGESTYGGDKVSTWVGKLKEHAGALNLVKKEQTCNWQRLRTCCLIRFSTLAHDSDDGCGAKCNLVVKAAGRFLQALQSRNVEEGLW